MLNVKKGIKNMNTLERILNLISQRGILEKQFLLDIGLNKSALSDWKKGTTKSYEKTHR